MTRDSTPNTEQPVSPRAARHAARYVDHVVPDLSHEDVARLAYKIYVRSGMIDGCCTHNWYQAEHELRHQRIRDELMSEPVTVVSSNERYSEVLNRRNPKADARLMDAVLNTKPTKAMRARSTFQPIGSSEGQDNTDDEHRRGGLPMCESTLTMAQQVAKAANALQQQRTDIAPTAITVVPRNSSHANLEKRMS